jgi:hypothetical protein
MLYRNYTTEGWMWWFMPVIIDNQEAKIEGSQFKASPGKLPRLYVKNKPDMVEHACGSSSLESRGRRIEVEGCPRTISMRPYLKNKLKVKGLGA